MIQMILTNSPRITWRKFWPSTCASGKSNHLNEWWKLWWVMKKVGETSDPWSENYKLLVSIITSTISVVALPFLAPSPDFVVFPPPPSRHDHVFPVFHHHHSFKVVLPSPPHRYRSADFTSLRIAPQQFYCCSSFSTAPPRLFWLHTFSSTTTTIFLSSFPLHHTATIMLSFLLDHHQHHHHNNNVIVFLLSPPHWHD